MKGLGDVKLPAHTQSRCDGMVWRKEPEQQQKKKSDGNSNNKD